MMFFSQGCPSCAGAQVLEAPGRSFAKRACSWCQARQAVSCWLCHGQHRLLSRGTRRNMNNLLMFNALCFNTPALMLQ